MPKSKRDKKVSLTKTTKKGLKAKQNLVEKIRNSVGKFKSIFVFSVNEMRNQTLKELREEWDDSRFFFGKNKVMALGLGRQKEDELEENLHKLSGLLKGQCGLLFTNRSKDDVVEYFQSFESSEFARAGFTPMKTVKLPEGPLVDFAHSIEPHLRSLGMPTALKKGVVTLLSEFKVCKRGKPLTAQQASILKLLGHQLATFKVTLIGFWSKGGTFELLHKEPFKPVKKEITSLADEEDDDDEENDVEMENN